MKTSKAWRLRYLAAGGMVSVFFEFKQITRRILIIQARKGVWNIVHVSGFPSELVWTVCACILVSRLV